MDQPKRGEGERAPPEIEIIPPDRAHSFRERGRTRIVFSFGTHHGRPGQASLSPLAVVLAGAIFIVLAGLIAVAVVGTLLIWIPLVLLVVVAAMAVGFLRRFIHLSR